MTLWDECIRWDISGRVIILYVITWLQHKVIKFCGECDDVFECINITEVQ